MFFQAELKKIYDDWINNNNKNNNNRNTSGIDRTIGRRDAAHVPDVAHAGPPVDRRHHRASQERIDEPRLLEEGKRKAA